MGPSAAWCREAVSGGHSWTNGRKDWWQVVASAIRKLEMIRHIGPATIHPSHSHNPPPAHTYSFDCPTPELHRWSCKVLRVKSLCLLTTPLVSDTLPHSLTFALPLIPSSHMHCPHTKCSQLRTVYVRVHTADA